MIYIDNNATTPVDPEVFKAMEPYLKEEYGNPSSKYYSLAVNANLAVEKARKQVASLINADPNNIIFTSSGTESNNFIIKGAADYFKNIRKKGNHLLTSSVEHSSITRSFEYLNGNTYQNIDSSYPPIDRGYRAEILDVNEYGQVELDLLEKSIKKDTILGSFIWVNNETGNINKIPEIVNLFNKKEVFIHSDATQAVGKLDIDVKKLNIDAISFSAHKIYGPKGVGAVYIKDLGKISSLIHGGGGQEHGLRAGTLCVHNIVGFGKAAEIIKEEMEENNQKMKKLTLEFKNLLQKKYENIIFVGKEGEFLPGLVSFIIPGLNSVERIRALSDKLAMSSGSACSAGGESPVLTAIGRPEYGSNFFRVGFNKYTSSDDLKIAVELI